MSLAISSNRHRRSPPRSLYRKIALVVRVAGAGRASSADDLVRTIAEGGHLDFTRPAPGEDGPVLLPCSEATTHRAVELCQTLRLVDAKGHLTRDGLRALGNERFDEVLARAVTAELDRNGWRFTAIDQATRALLATEGSQLPTIDAVVAKILGDADRRTAATLRTLIGLLVATGSIGESRRRLLLPAGLQEA